MKMFRVPFFYEESGSVTVGAKDVEEAVDRVKRFLEIDGVNSLKQMSSFQLLSSDYGVSRSDVEEEKEG